MSVTPAQFRRMALSFPETSESAHQGHPDFRVLGKVFATLGYPDKKWAMVKLTPEQQEVFMADEPSVFIPGSGRLGACRRDHRSAQSGRTKDAAPRHPRRVAQRGPETPREEI